MLDLFGIAKNLSLTGTPRERPPIPRLEKEFYVHTHKSQHMYIAIGSRFGALAEEEYDKIAPVIACTLPALTDSIPKESEREGSSQE